MDFIDEAKDILSGCFFIPKETIDAKAEISSIKTLDSLSFEMLVMEVEARTGKPVDPVIFLDLRTVEDLANILRDQMLREKA